MRNISAVLFSLMALIAVPTIADGDNNSSSAQSITTTTTTTTATTPQSPPKPSCSKPWQHNRYARYVLRYSDNNGDYHASAVTRRQIVKLGKMRSCVKHAGYKVAYLKMLHYWHLRHGQWKFFHHIDAITVYGKWSIPEYIVMRESGGNRCAKNPNSTAGGYYQFLTTSWQAYGGEGTAQCAPDWEQHEVAARAWDGGRGSSNWALTR